LPSEAAPRIPERDPPPSWPERGAIELDNITMRYRPEPAPVLRGVSPANMAAKIRFAVQQRCETAGDQFRALSHGRRRNLAVEEGLTVSHEDLSRKIASLFDFHATNRFVQRCREETNRFHVFATKSMCGPALPAAVRQRRGERGGRRFSRRRGSGAR
jgi:hypothetical protein